MKLFTNVRDIAVKTYAKARRSVRSFQNRTSIVLHRWNRDVRYELKRNAKRSRAAIRAAAIAALGRVQDSICTARRAAAYLTQAAEKITGKISARVTPLVRSGVWWTRLGLSRGLELAAVCAVFLALGLMSGCQMMHPDPIGSLHRPLSPDNAVFEVPVRPRTSTARPAPVPVSPAPDNRQELDIEKITAEFTQGWNHTCEESERIEDGSVRFQFVLEEVAPRLYSAAKEAKRASEARTRDKEVAAFEAGLAMIEYAAKHGPEIEAEILKIPADAR